MPATLPDTEPYEVLSPPAEPPRKRPPTTGTMPPQRPQPRSKPTPDLGYRDPTPLWKAGLIVMALAVLVVLLVKALT